MGAHSFEDLILHHGHKVEVATYGAPPVNVAVECLDCNEVIVDFDKEYEEDPNEITPCLVCGEPKPNNVSCPNCRYLDYMEKTNHGGLGRTLDAAIIAYRENPTSENRAWLDSVQERYTKAMWNDHWKELTGENQA